MVDARLIAAKPEDVGVDADKLEAVFARAKKEVDDGNLPSAQVAVARHGKIAGMRAFGKTLHGNDERPATNDSLFTIFSCTKAIVGAATWSLIEDGLLRIEEKVADIIPEFATNGKENVTVEQVMLHIGGFPMAPLGAPAWETKEGRLAAFSRWRLNWEPGSQFQYHATSAHWVLAEIIERRTNTNWQTFLRQRILDPMGLDNFYVGLPDGMNDQVADVLHVTPPQPPPGGWGEVTPDAILNFNKPSVRNVGVPGGGGIATAAGLALFYAPLVNGGVTGTGTPILKQSTIDYATIVRTDDRHRDAINDIPINRALTVMVAGADGNAHLRGFGKNTSPRAFGHGGAGGQIGWGDPESGISLGFCTNGFVEADVMARRNTALSSLAAVCAK